MATKNRRAKARSGPLSGRFTRNGWLTGAGVAVVAGLGAAFVLAAAIRWSDIGTDLMTVLSGNQADGRVLGITDAPAGAPEGAYIVTVEFMTAAGSQRVSRRLVESSGTDVAPRNRIRSDRPVRVSYRAGAPDRAVLWTPHEPWAVVWTLPVGLALLAVAWGLRPRT